MRWLKNIMRPPADEAQPAVMFMHFFKTGGTSVHTAAAAGVGKPMLCPIRQEGAYPSVEAFRADTPQFLSARLISGHFDWRRLADIRRHKPCLCVVQLRDPLDRIASAYNFLRAHRIDKHPNLKDSGLQRRDMIEAARTMPAEEFLRSRWARTAPAFNNTYVQALAPHEGRGAGGFSPENLDERTEVACERVLSCDHVGFLGDQVPTVNFIRRSLGLSEVASVMHLKRTAQEMNWHKWLEPVELVSGGDLEPYVSDLVRGDRMVYQTAANVLHAGEITPQ